MYQVSLDDYDLKQLYLLKQTNHIGNDLSEIEIPSIRSSKISQNHNPVKNSYQSHDNELTKLQPQYQKQQLYSQQCLHYQIINNENSLQNGKQTDLYTTQLEFDQIISITEQPTQAQGGFLSIQSADTTTINRKKSRVIYNKKPKKNRKIRTTITKQKLSQMNKIFSEYTMQKQQGKNPQFNLKQIGQHLQLGYSTILHKFRQFRATKKVKGGALIASLQKKRKYKKSLQIQQIIEKALTQRPFYTAVELSRFILCKFDRNFSRSIISRHLGDMGYSYKNIKTTPIQKNKLKYKQIRRMYANILDPMIKDEKINKNIIYIDEMACSLSTLFKKRTNQSKKTQIKQQDDYISLLIAARNQQIIMYDIKYGFFTRQDYCNSLMNIHKIMNRINKYNSLSYEKTIFIINDLNKIHRDICQGEKEIIKQTLHRLNMKQYFLPPFSYQLNPLETIFLNIKNKMSKKDIRTIDQLHVEIIQYMNQLSEENIEVHFKEIPDWILKSLNQENF